MAMNDAAKVAWLAALTAHRGRGASNSCLYGGCCSGCCFFILTHWRCMRAAGGACCCTSSTAAAATAAATLILWWHAEAQERTDARCALHIEQAALRVLQTRFL